VISESFIWRRLLRYQSLVCILLACFWGQALAIASATSMTIDEGLHIASGYTIWRTGDYRLIEEHPPLAKLWMAIPLLPLPDLADPTHLPAWERAAEPTTESLPLLQMAQQLLYPYRPIDRWLYPARTMSALLGILLLAVLCRWSHDLTGRTGSLIALALAAFDPNLLAHAAVAGTDLGAATFITLGLWRATVFLRGPSRRDALATGIALGLALAAKLTAMLLGPALALVGFIKLISLPRKQRRHLVRLSISIVLIALVALWAIYGFHIGALPGVPVPVPAAAHSIPIMRLLSHSQGGHQAYLLGQNSTEGWWFYFPIAFLIKTPVTTLLAMLAGLLMAFTECRQQADQRALWRLLSFPPLHFAAVYTVASLTSSLNIGYRHLLPLLPLVYLAAAQIGHRLPNRSSPGRISYIITVSLLLICQTATTMTQIPDLLPFFNLIVGGSEEGWRYLADSNTDWGQGYKALAAYQRAQKTEKVNLAAFIFYDPAVYGVDYRPLPPLGGDTPAIFPSRFAPPAGDYAISATPLDGIPTADEAMYDWFRWREPDAKPGNALFVYHVTAEETATHWTAQCITPTTALDNDAIKAGFGDVPERTLQFDCTQTWVYPSSENGPGAFVLHGALLEDDLPARLRYRAPAGLTPFIDAHLAQTTITYWQRAYRDTPSFAIFRSQISPEADHNWLDSETLPVPLALAGPLTYLGAIQRACEVETWWQVTERPSDRPFSIMGHLLSSDGTMLEVSDGLGLAHTSLHPEDILVQRHAFSCSAGETVGLRFQTGIYWRDTGERWLITERENGKPPSGIDTITIPLNNRG
jgi:hypothetical protein